MAYVPKTIQFTSVQGGTSTRVPFFGSDGFLTESAGLTWGDSARTLTLFETTATAADSPILAISRGKATAVVANDRLGQVSFLGFDGTNQVLGARIYGIASGTWSGTNSTSQIRFSMPPSASQTVTDALIVYAASSLLGVIQAPINGIKIGDAITQKFGFWNATPVVQQAANAALTDNSGGTASVTLAAISNALSGVSCGAVGCNANHNTAAALNTELGTIRNAVASLAARFAEIRTLLLNTGLGA